MPKSCALPKSVFPRKFKVTSPVHALQLARQLIRPFRHWTVNALAVDGASRGLGNKFEIDVKSPKAEAFCALGALRRVNTKHQVKAQTYLEMAAGELKGLDMCEPSEDDIFAVNDAAYDKKTHRRVLKMFTRAIQLARRLA